MSNLFAHITYHDNPHTNFLLKRQFKMIVKHMQQVENRGAYYITILEAVARSIRIQLTRFGRNALDPVLESFFQSTGIPRDTDSLEGLEEIARFLSYYAYVNERRTKSNNNNNDNNANVERDSVKGGATSSNRDSVPDWVPYAESSVANRSIRDFSHSATTNDDPKEEVAAAAAAVRANGGVVVPPSIPTVMEQTGRSRRRRSSTTSRRFQRTMQSLRKIPSSLWRSGRGKGGSRRRRHHEGETSIWRADEITEEFSISVGIPLDDDSTPTLLDHHK